MNKKLLIDLFRIPSLPFEETKTAEFIESQLKNLAITYKIDELGNIYNIDNIYKPLLCAHMDTVQDETDGKLAKFIRMYDNIIKGYGVIGADDKAGIYAILDLLENGEEINFLFTTGEEVGGIGVQGFIEKNDISFIPYGLIIDRRGNGDIICENNEYGTSEFANTLELMGSSFGFSKSTGTFSDADYLSEQISCANLSCGYYGAHTKHEFLDLNELNNTINYVHSVIKHIDSSFEAPHKKFSYDKVLSMYNYEDSEYVKDYTFKECDICKTLDVDITYVYTIRKNLCPDCISRLMWELETSSYDLDLFDYTMERY